MFQNLDRRQKWGSYGIGILVLFVLGVIGSTYMYSPQPFQVDHQGFSGQAIAPTTPSTLKVSGAVKKPGEFTFAAGMRVSDAIDRAGDETDGADLTQIDLSAYLFHGADLVVPRIGSDYSGPYARVSPSSKGLAPNSISINTASAEELEKLSYIGPKKAAAIVEYRLRIGQFSSLEEIKGVTGIGDGIYNKIKPYIKL